VYRSLIEVVQPIRSGQYLFIERFTALIHSDFFGDGYLVFVPSKASNRFLQMFSRRFFQYERRGYNGYAYGRQNKWLNDTPKGHYNSQNLQYFLRSPNLSVSVPMHSGVWIFAEKFSERFV